MAKKALAKAPPGALLTMLADDPLAAVDIPHMCHEEGHGLHGVVQADGHYVFTIRRGSGTPAAGSPAATDAR
jgi:tRNA 2-thiouridine synthesizing protein A